MIISHSNRFIFFAVPRTGTHAIRQALQPYLGADDWQQQSLNGIEKIPLPKICDILHGHISVKEIRPALAESIWRNYFKFAFVRNPFDRYVSVCSFLTRANPNITKDMESFMEVAIQRPKFRQRILVRPQTEMLTDIHGDIPLDFVGRFENFQQDFNNICKAINLKPQIVDKINTSAHHDFRRYYQLESTIKYITDFYHQDFNLLDYNPNLHATQ